MAIVSIIIPAYNPGEYLKSTVLSVLAQTFEDWELIIVDDGSKEDIRYIQDYSSRIRIIHQKNYGLSIARNVGIMSATSEYLAFVDADDLWEPTKLERQLQCFAANSNVALCHTNFDLVDEHGEHLGEGFGRHQPSYYEMLRGNGVCVSTVMVQRQRLGVTGLFDSGYRSVQDYDLWLKLGHNFGTAFVPTCEAHYRSHSNNMSRNYRTMYFEAIEVLRKNQAMAIAAGDRTAQEAIQQNVARYNVSFGTQAFELSRACVRERDWKQFLQHYTFGFQRLPGYVLKSSLAYFLPRKHPQAVPEGQGQHANAL